MMSGLTGRTSSTSMDSFVRDDGRKFVRNTSLRVISSSSKGRASVLSSASPTLRFPRLGASMIGANDDPGTVAAAPNTFTNPRWASPVTGCSIFTTSAPQSASTAPADGTKVNCATSRTRTPLSGLCIRCPSSEGGRDAHSVHDVSDLRLLVALEQCRAGVLHVSPPMRLGLSAVACRHQIGEPPVGSDQLGVLRLGDDVLNAEKCCSHVPDENFVQHSGDHGQRRVARQSDQPTVKCGGRRAQPARLPRMGYLLNEVA